MKVFYSIVLIAFVSVAALGFWGLSASTEFVNCASNLVNAASCASNHSASGLALAEIYLALVLTVLTFGFLLAIRIFGVRFFDFQIFLGFEETETKNFQTKFFHWLGLLERKTANS